MATFNKFNSFVDASWKKLHNLNTGGDVLKIMLTDTAPVATNAVKTDITEITAGNGYTAGGATTTQTLSNSSGTETLALSAVTFTASGGAIAQWRYAVLYNSTNSLLMGWADNGAEINLAGGATETVSFGNLTLS